MSTSHRVASRILPSAGNDDAAYVIDHTFGAGTVVAGTISGHTPLSTAGARNYATTNGNGGGDSLDDPLSAWGTGHGRFAAVATISATASIDNYPSFDRHTTFDAGHDPCARIINAVSG